MLRDGSQQLDHAILEALHSSDQPMGSWSIYYLLKERGFSASAPTIGRRLRDLERQNFVGKVTVEGRSITPNGIRVLHSSAHDHRIRNTAEEVLKLLKSNRRKDILDLLQARRVIEGESARLAAMFATKKDIAMLEDIVRRQRNQVERGALGVKEDVDFHESLARISGNRFIAYSVHLLRSHEWMNNAVIAIRAKIGKPIVDHEKLVAALRAHNPNSAQKIMEKHITRMMGEVERYWNKVFR